MRRASIAIAVLGCAACGGEPAPPPEASWQLVHEDLPGAFMSVWGTTSSDVWAVGADPGDGKGPQVVHFDGQRWTRELTGATGDLWWVTGFDDGTVFMGGEDGLLLRYRAGQFETLQTPGTGIIFGVWGASPDDVWAVGGNQGGASGAFAWRTAGAPAGTLIEAPGFPVELAATDAIWKIFGLTADDVWMVGTNGVILHSDGDAIERVPSDTTRSLFTVDASATVAVAVGGFANATVVENDGSGWVDVSEPNMFALIGVDVTDDDGYAVGSDGAVYRRTEDGWQQEQTGLAILDQLHSVWIDPDGGVWAAGGQVVAEPLVRGVLIYKGFPEIPGGTIVEP